MRPHVTRHTESSQNDVQTTDSRRVCVWLSKNLSQFSYKLELECASAVMLGRGLVDAIGAAAAAAVAMIHSGTLDGRASLEEALARLVLAAPIAAPILLGTGSALAGNSRSDNNSRRSSSSVDMAAEEY